MIRFNGISVTYKNKNTDVRVMEKFDVTLRKNDFTCILGPSGSGKTTILNIIAGLQSQTEGELLVDSVAGAKPKMSYVFQGHNIFPWKTVRQNIAFGLGGAKDDIAETNRRIEELARELGLFDHLDVYPDSLSGGMKQRVGIGRALIGDPDIILMDEPFASLDALTAFKLRRLLKDLCSERPTTIVFVTHNIEEALELGDRILVVSRSPMQILIDKKIKKEAKTNVVSSAELKDKIYDALKSNMSE